MLTEIQRQLKEGSFAEISGEAEANMKTPLNKSCELLLLLCEREMCLILKREFNHIIHNFI